MGNLPRCFVAVCLGAAIGLLAPVIAADIVHLRGGRVLEGLVIEFPDSVEIEGRHGSVTVTRSQIERIERKPVPWIEYENRRLGLKKEDAEGHYQLGRYCKENGLRDEAQLEFNTAIAADPEHAGARAALGFKHVGNHWLTDDEVKRELGFVQVDGVWLKPEEARLREEMAREAALQADLKKQIAALIEQVGFADEAVREQAQTSLDQLDPALRIPYLRKVLEHDNPAIRMYAILELGRHKARIAAGELAARVLVDPIAELREVAVAALQNVECETPHTYFQAALGDGRVLVRIRACAALTLFPHKDATGPLLESLERTLQRQAAPPQVLSGGVITAGDQRGGRFQEPSQYGEASSVISTQATEDPVALAELERVWLRKAMKACTGYDFGLNLQMWHFWWRKELERRVNGGASQSSDKDSE